MVAYIPAVALTPAVIIDGQMPAASPLMKIASRLHAFAYRSTGGRIGGRLGRLPILLLTTAGRKSGRIRTVPLVYLGDAGNLVIVASNAGHDWHPSWFSNLRDNPQAAVQVGRTRLLVRADTATSEERERLWPEVIAMWPGYAAYQEKTRREIPLVVLRPLE